MFLDRRRFTATLCALVACRPQPSEAAGPAPEPGVRDLPADPATVTALTLSDEEWKAKLDKEAYYVLRQKGTERAFTGRYADHHAKGTYVCAGCGLALFRSEDKFESGTGWPSFTQAIKPGRVTEVSDVSYGMVRVEVNCARCAGHLGHVFDDGPAPTGLRYCMNSVSLVFRGA